MTTYVMGIDPGNTESAYAVIDQADRRPIKIGKVPNDQLIHHARNAGLERDGGLLVDVVAVEMVASYGMAVGREVFETCVWIGRYVEALHTRNPQLVYRRDVKLHHCHNGAAKDANITQALIDRFASGVRNRGKGTKADPGWFYGFHSDIWQAYALAVHVADTLVSQPMPVGAGASARMEAPF